MPLAPQSSAPSPPRTEAPATTVAADPSAAWAALLRQTAGKSALAWIARLELRQLDGGQVTLAVRPGDRDLLKFVGDRQREQIAGLLSPLLGRPVRVSIESTGAASTLDAAAAGDESTPVAAQAFAIERQRGLDLPLVRQVMKEFDATVLEVRPDVAVEPAATDSGAEHESELDGGTALDDDPPPLDEEPL